MTKIPRRRFLKGAAAAGYLTGSLTAATERIAILIAPADALGTASPVRWAADEVRRAVLEKGGTCAVVSSAGEAGDFEAAVIVTRSAD